mgnify:CR=1 FL=1
MNKIMIVALLVLAGCVSTSTSHHGPKDIDPCKEAGGVWYKGPMDRDYRCVDKKSLEESLRNSAYGMRA